MKTWSGFSEFGGGTDAAEAALQAGADDECAAMGVDYMAAALAIRSMTASPPTTRYATSPTRVSSRSPGAG